MIEIEGLVASWPGGVGRPAQAPARPMPLLEILQEARKKKEKEF